MFKYGNFKLFFVKFIIGSLFIIFSISLFLSLVTYSPEDPGFKKIVYVDNIQNSLGYFGAQLSSIMVVFWGNSSYFISLFLLIGTELTIFCNIFLSIKKFCPKLFLGLASTDFV